MYNIKNYKITVLGDSIAKGIVLQDDKILKIKDNAVQLISDEFGVNIDNQSQFGQTLKKLCQKKFIDRYIHTLDHNAKNCMVLSIGGNDSDFDWVRIGKEPTIDTSLAQNTPIDEFSQLLSNTIEKLQKSNVRVILTTLPPIDANKFFEYVIIKKAPIQNALAFLGHDLSNIYRFQEGFSNEIRRLATKYQCSLIDIRSVFLFQKYLGKLLCADGIHPNVDGQKLMANYIIEGIKNKNLYS